MLHVTLDCKYCAEHVELFLLTEIFETKKRECCDFITPKYLKPVFNLITLYLNYATLILIFANVDSQKGDKERTNKV